MLRTMLESAAHESFPPVDGVVEVFPPGDDGHLAIVEFTGHAVVLGNIAPTELTAMGADGFGGVSRPEIKLALAGAGGWVGTHDAVLVAAGRGDGRDGPLDERLDLEEHPRVVRSRAHRTNVVVLGGDHGLVTLGHGLVGRTEISVELFEPTHPTSSRRSNGRALIESGLRHVARDEFAWAQVAPGNAASLRAFLAAGFVPIGAETLIVAAR